MRINALCIFGTMVIPCCTYCEVLPTGQQERFFSDRSFAISPCWEILTLPSGKKFQMVTGYSEVNTIIETESGPRAFGEIPWVREGVVRVEYDDIKDPNSKAYKDLLTKKTNPIMLFGRYLWWEKYDLNTVLRAQKDFGKRFLCLDYGEWSWGGTSITFEDLKYGCEKLFHMPLPSNRDEGADWWNRDYDRYFKRFQDAGVPIYSWNATYLGHYEGRKGAAYIGNEIGNAISCAPMQIAFCRGASRQFGVPWAIYAASNGWGGGETDFSTFIRPEERRALSNGWYSGPLAGHTLAMQKRYLVASYMAGASFYQRENYRSLANYDEATVAATDPRVLLLRDVKCYQSPTAQFYDKFYTNIVQKRDRGVPYTPIALMFDRHHGFVLTYDRTHIVGNVAYTRGDEQMRAMTNTLFPWENKAPNDTSTLVTGPFGDIFDAITTDAKKEVIGSYRAVVLAGESRVDATLAKVLKEFVERGGTLFMSCEQLTPELRELAGVADTGEIGTDNSFARASDFYTYFELPFDYHKVKLSGGARALFVANDPGARDWPVATIRKAGKGSVIVGTPVWMTAKGSATQMHGVFSEIMTMIADELVPVCVYGDAVEVLYNKNKNGWVVTLINNEGVIRNWPGYKDARREYSAAGVILEARFKYSQATEWMSGEKFGAKASMVVPPGETRIVEFH